MGINRIGETSNRCAADGAHRAASLVLIAPPRAASDDRTKDKPLRVADIQQELSRREVPTMTESLPSGMPPGLSRRLTMTPMELVYESAIQYITSRNPASLLRTMGGSLSRTVTRLSTLATTYGPISLGPSLRAGSLRGMSWVDNQTFCRQPYHPVAQDWLPTEAKQG